MLALICFFYFIFGLCPMFVCVTYFAKKKNKKTKQNKTKTKTKKAFLNSNDSILPKCKKRKLNPETCAAVESNDNSKDSSNGSWYDSGNLGDDCKMSENLVKFACVCQSFLICFLFLCHTIYHRNKKKPQN